MNSFSKNLILKRYTHVSDSLISHLLMSVTIIVHLKKYTSSFNMNLLSQVHSEEPELALCKVTGATAMEECK